MTRPDLTMVPEPSRLRVITAGDVGNVHSRLGSSGFDVVAVVDTEADLVVAVTSDEPDAIVVEADLCESLEHVHELAPDATLIVVGDHTPAGALGHIDKGVSATVLAGLLHALATGGASAAIAVPGFVLAPSASVPAAPAVHAVGVRQAVTAGVVGAVVVAGVALGLMMARSPSEERASVVPSSPPPAISAPAPPPAVEEPTDAPSPPSKPEPSPSVGRAEAPPPDVPSPTQAPPSEPPPPPADEPATSARPPGRAHGWDHRPPKVHDHGLHKGWVKGHGPKT